MSSPAETKGKDTEYKFYVKASPDNSRLGDCPFTHRANLALKIKGVKNVSMVLIDLTNKPSWYKDINAAGSVPTLEFDGRVITDSYEIVKYLDETYPDPPLEPHNNKEAEEVTGNVFTVFSNWVKVHDKATDTERRDKLTEELRKIDEYIGTHSWAFLCSDQWSIADCVLVPRLYHIFVVATNVLDYHEFDTMPNLKAYMEHAFSSDAFKATDYPIEYITQGWAKYTDGRD